MHNPSTFARRVVITGMGAVTPCGNTAADTWAALIAGRSGIGRITRFDATGCTAQIAGEVRNFDPARRLPVPLRPRGAVGEPLLQALTAKGVKKFGRFTHLGCGAVEAYADSGLDAHRATVSAERMGVNLGVGLGGLPEMEAMHDTWKAGGFRKISPFFIIQIAPNLLAGQVSLLLDFRGANMSVASACATSGHALGEAAAAIVRDDADVMIAGGAESPSRPGDRGIAQMRALSTRNDAPEKPRDPTTGTAMGLCSRKGAVVLVLEEREHALAARCPHLCRVARLRGFRGCLSPFVALAPGAEGSARSMRAALDRAGLAPSEVDYVSAHATSTPGGDGEEAAAIARVFAENKSSLNVSGVKSMTGHLLGAAGAMGVFAAVLAVHHGIVPPTINLDNVDPACGDLGLDLTPNTAVRRTVRAALANSFGFGGTNASIVVARAWGACRISSLSVGCSLLVRMESHLLDQTGC